MLQADIPMSQSSTVGQGSVVALFRPKSIAVVGASANSIWGRQALESFKAFDYSGQVIAINPKYEEVLGFPCYPTLRSAPFVPEAIFVLRDGASTLRVIEEAAEIGVRAAVAVATGFAEAGGEGIEAQARLTEIVRRAGMAIVGPNCSGLINYVDQVPMHLGVVERKQPGCVALFAQGGGPKSSLAGNDRGVHWSHIVSCGNEAVTGIADYLAYFVDEPKVKVICGFIETIRQPDRFFHECSRARQAGKAVVLLKAGRTEASRKMAAAHTGALAAPHRLYRELFRRHGVVQVDSFEELLSVALVLQARLSPGQGRLGVAHPSGGILELILDQTAKCDALSYPEFSAGTLRDLQGAIADYTECKNPLDTWSTAANLADSNPRILKAVANDPNVDVVITHYDPNQLTTSYAHEHEIFARSAVEAASSASKLVTLLTPLEGSASAESVRDFLAKDVLVLSLQEGFRALDHAVKWRRPIPPIAEELSVDTSKLIEIIDKVGGKPFAGEPALEFLAAAGITVVGSRFVRTPADAVQAAEELGFPVVVKIGDTDVLHRTELSGVFTNLRDAEQVSRVARELLAAGARVVIVQPFIRDGLEMILGLETDNVLGSFVLVGQGGIWTEIMDDAALRPAGLRVGEPDQMLAELRSEPLLRGARGAPALDKAALIAAIKRLDAIARSMGDKLRSIDVNPLFVRQNGVIAVDALIVPRTA
ncbi:acetate--CoA ligase family protein [Bradyrhizobium sp. UFLA05-112]